MAYNDIVYCPACRKGLMEPVGKTSSGFSVGKAALGAAAVGPVGLVAGALGKTKKVYRCLNCGYTMEK